MGQVNRWKTLPADREILRRLAARVREIAELPIMAERRRLWKKHASLQGERPMILAETQGVIPELPIDAALLCQEPWARDLERKLRLLIFQHERVDDDYVLEPWLDCPWKTDLGNYGVVVEKVRGDNEGRLGSYVWDAPIKDLDRDLDKLTSRRFAVDREGTLAWKAHLEEAPSTSGLVGASTASSPCASAATTTGPWASPGRGADQVSSGRRIDLIGLQHLMLAMYDNPQGLHRVMAFLRDDHLALVDWLTREGLYTLNNENDYVGSGTVGYTDELPGATWRPGDPVTPADLWVLSESQETVGVSPGMFAEFIFPYQLPIIERFGLCYYGCCEPVHARWPILKRIPNLRRVSVSPWCDQEYMAEAMGRDYIFCRKPNPALISHARWDEEAIRADLRYTVAVARGCPLEIVMKDVHTLSDQPERLGRWVRLARQESEGR